MTSSNLWQSSRIAHLRLLLKAFSLCSSPLEHPCHINGPQPAWAPCLLAAARGICWLLLVSRLVARFLQCRRCQVCHATPCIQQSLLN